MIRSSLSPPATQILAPSGVAFPTRASTAVQRRLLVLSATALVRYALNRLKIATCINGQLLRGRHEWSSSPWANKLARIAWAVMAGGEDYRGGAVTVS